MDRPAGEMIVDRDFIVTARDGVEAATDVYRPAGDGRFPVLLERTPYDKSAPSRSERTAAARNAVVSSRGGRLLYRTRLCRHLSGLPRPLPVRWQVYEISERGRGRFRRARVAGAPALVRWPHWHVRAI